ncbi:MAG: hypothetical protein EAZ76_07500 [Nostocales cyanobacterium]|nr:MAG: hypothetical protein EAZ87_11945 [Nostocales cyanobacterium]TAF16412.1 MAG: hypothetical protein EAZ76_07500 [Nostocales cyanobacterium]
MLKTIVLIIIGLLPSIWSLWVLRKKQERIRNRNRQIAQNYTPITEYIRPIEGDRYYLEGVGYLIGDISCKFNARSGYMRCAVNPSGPCENCRHYESQEVNNYQSQSKH